MTRAELLEKAKPILFNTEMVRAILDGRKTATRQVIKVPANAFVGEDEDGFFAEIEELPSLVVKSLCPKYNPYDVLYVKETWQHCYYLDENDQIIEDTERYVYAASPETIPNFTEWVDGDGEHRDCMPWRPSIHMPKEAARIILRVTNVRVERLQDITVEDAKREGAFLSCNMCVHWHDFCGQQVTQAKDCKIDGIAPLFPRLWNSTIRPADMPKYGWDANPWVWVYEFERVVPE